MKISRENNLNSSVFLVIFLESAQLSIEIVHVSNLEEGQLVDDYSNDTLPFLAHLLSDVSLVEMSGAVNSHPSKQCCRRPGSGGEVESIVVKRQTHCLTEVVTILL